ncbi:DUF4157 domain-containing protein [Streptomyces sp. NPDC088794]|uniref:eCIS core domain-containing protein n=1 Tax=Streptomyces sp. NPDC088794 TaxID=3365902 RepID=UPI00381DC67C
MRSLQPEANPATAPRTVTARGRGEVRESDHPGGRLQGLQRRYGNRRARSMIQAKLNVGPVDDHYEREADRIALLATGASAQRAPEAAKHVPGAAGGVADSSVSQAVTRVGGAGREVPAGVRKRMERVSGADFSDVRVHVNAGADRLNDALGSRAFTVGSDVFVRRSEYRPGSARGDALLAHELTHTVQQGGAPLASSEAATAVTPVVQRAFGFELELPSVPVFSTKSGKENEGLRFPPLYDEHHSIGKIQNGHDIHCDKSDKLFRWIAFAQPWCRTENLDELPIVELVTPPFQESWSRGRVKAEMRPLVVAAEHIRTVMANQCELPVQALYGVTKSVSPDNRIGFPKAAYEGWKGGPLGDAPPVDVSAHVQATYGLPLRSVGNVFRKRGERDRTQAPDTARFTQMMQNSQDDLTDANTIATNCVNAMREDAKGKKYRKYNLDNNAFAAAHGFFALIANYLYSASRQKISVTKDLGKNRLGLYYYKTSLDTVRNQLGEAYPGIGQLLKKNNKKYHDILLANTKRSNTWSMFVTGKDATGEKTVKSWVTAVLQGSSDFVFRDTKNPWSDELFFSESPGVVVENRKFAQTEGHEYTHEYPPTEWPEMAARVWDFLQNKDT